MVDRRLYDLTEKGTAEADDYIWQDKLGQPEAQKLSVQKIIDAVPVPSGDMEQATYDPAGKARQLAAEDELYTDGQADARIAAADVENLNNVSGGATEGEVLVSRTGVWTPEPLPSGGTGDMETAVYDPAGIAEQLVGIDASQTIAEKFHEKTRWIRRHIRRQTGLGSGSIPLSLSTHGDIYSFEFTGAVSVQFTDPGPDGQYQEFVLELDGQGTGSVTLPGSVQWPGGAPSIDFTKRNVLGFWSRDGGTVWNGVVIGLDYQ